jgi:hypothetical protein
MDAPPNAALRWYRRLTLLGIVINLTFALPAMFAPDQLIALLGDTTAQFAYVWLANAGMLLLQASLFYLPAAYRPERYTVYAWLGAFARLGASVFWFWQARSEHLSGPMGTFWTTDGFFSVASIILLQLGLPADRKISGANLKRAVSDIGANLRAHFATTRSRLFAGAVAALLAFVGYVAWANFVRAIPDTVFPSPEEQFKYGAIGLGMNARIPLYLFEVMPEICSDLMPDGADTDGRGTWAAFGLLYEPGKSLPVGFAQRQIGYPSVEPNCALCHTGSVRTAADAAPTILPGAPAHQLDLEAFQWFLYDCAADARFTSAAVTAAIEKNHDLSAIQKAVYRFAIVPFAKQMLAAQGRAYAWQKTRPAQGRGRTDTFNPTKINVFHMPDDHSIGTVDLPAIWNQKARVGLWLHWDGNNNEIQERNYAAAMAIGATPKSVLPSHFEMVTNYVLELPAPKYPFPVDAAKAAQGAPLFATHCAGCHGLGVPGSKVGTVTDIAEIKTDRHRLDSFTEALVERFHAIDEPPFVFGAYRKTNGYSNLPIDAPWARASFLHNGSVPTLWDLLQPPANRPQRFWRGGNLYDPVKVGFASAQGNGNDFLYETGTPGNGNEGHEFGTALSDDEKWALIEFLKTM